MNIWLAVFLGGGAGSMIRFALSRAVLAFIGIAAFPVATLLSNLFATALLAWVMLRWELHLPGKEQWQALLAIGFCGGFSTFSAFSMENHQLLRDGFVGLAVLNIVISVVVGVLLFHLMARSA